MMSSLFAPLRRYYAPPPQAPRLPEAEIRHIYPRYRWQVLEATFLGYAMYYLVRNNINVVAADMEETLHYSKSMIGAIMGITAISYGLSKFVMGSVSDRSDARKFMATGLLLSAILNFAFGTSDEYSAHLMLWSLNGFVQGMGWPPCGRVMGHWFSESERGLTFSIWNTSHNLGAGIAGWLAAKAVIELGGWQYAFYVPGGIAAIGAAYLFWRLRDTPQSVGLPPIEEYRNDYPEGDVDAAEHERTLTFKELMLDKVLLNKYVWLLAIANFFAYITRYSMIYWGPTYLRETKGASLVEGGWAIFAIEFGGIPSTILFGWLSDKIGGRRGMVATLCMIPIILAFAVIANTPVSRMWLDMLMLVTIGCFVYPVINLITIAALDVASKKAIGTAAGFIGLFGYIGAAVQSTAFGAIVDHYTPIYGKLAAWNIVLYTIIGCGVAAMVLLALTWNVRPKAWNETDDGELKGLDSK
jgi:MFS transporter, OPA family, glycerol-3-phosphate transporter